MMQKGIKMRVVTADSGDGNYIRVWMNFREVTNRTFYAELPDYPFIPGVGLFKMHKLDEHGKRYLVSEYGGKYNAEEEVRGVCWFINKKDFSKGK